jgi:formiminotetrahydrofolate cyclodeaminase
VLIHIRPNARHRPVPASREGAHVRNDTIDSFLNALADRVPAPGGGASAALHAAQAAALVAMVARYTEGPRFTEHADLVHKVRDTADQLRDDALALAEDDVTAFTAVTEAYRLPKGDDG